MKACVLFVLLVLSSNSFSQNISPQFSELKGMEDQSGNTHLFYRIYTSFANDPIYTWSNHIYHWNLFAEVDTLFITASGIENPGYNYSNWVSDVDYWDNNPDYFIYSGGQTFGPFFEGSAYVQRFDGFINYFGAFWGSANYIDISSSDDSLLFLGINTDGGFGLLSSSDGGRSWDSLSVIYQFLSINPFYENIYFVEDSDRKLFRTTDNGITFNLVDPDFLPDTRFWYDSDQLHIYRIGYGVLKISDNVGEQFSWDTRYTSGSGEKFFISVDYSISGTIYLADGKNIYLSTDYGDYFNLYKTFDRNIIGIYKKSNSDKLYAATKYKMYEITPGSIQIIKSLPIPDELLNYYPLAIGNKWVYDKTTVSYDPYPQYSHEILVKEVLRDSVASNGKQYYYLKDETVWEEDILERVDSSEGKVYRYLEDPGLPENEYLLDDLLAEVGDTVISYRMGYYPGSHTTVLAETDFYKWGLIKPKKVFEQYILHPPVYSLTQDIGLDSIYSYFDFGENWVVLKGCIIDGIVYGDTTAVSVENETKDIPAKFSLSQNYPNPFNPTTTIRYTIPELSFTTLKIYDVLGNEIATLVKEELPAGNYEVEFDARGLSSGLYFYRLKAGDFIKTKKMVLMK